MRDIRGKTALVTGAGSGIGRETALALAREGAKLILCDINEASLADARAEVDAISDCLLAEPLDVSNLEGMQAFADKVHTMVPALDILVNNAGVGLMGNFLSTTLEDWKWIVSINLWGPIYGCNLFIPKMVERNVGGHVVNVSSMLGYSVPPDLAGYTTTKFGIFGLSMCLLQDLRNHNIGVSVICPGLINTNIVNSARYRGTPDVDLTRKNALRAYKRRNYGPEKVAAAVVKAIKRNKAIVPVSPEAILSYYMHRLWPKAAYAAMRLIAKGVEG